MRASRSRARGSSLLLLGCLFFALDPGSGQTTTSIKILGGQYKSTYDVQSELNLARDIAEMREVEDGTGGADEERQREIYSTGLHSFVTDENGEEVPRSLASLSLKASEIMSQDFLYNVFRRSFYDLGVRVEEETPGDFDDKPVSEYANTVVNDLFSLDVPGIETEAALILNIWMAVAHELWVVLNACGRSDADTSVTMSLALDRAAALWIGEGQVRGDAERGQLLYNLAQKAGVRFNKGETSTVNEVEANEFIVASLNKIQGLVIDNKCAEGESGYLEVRRIILAIYAYMTVPLVQMLIHHIREQTTAEAGSERDFIELYALSIMPQVTFCDPTAYDQMVDLFITGTLDPSDRDRAIDILQSTYGCMHVTCEMIGSYLEGEVEQCSDEPPATPKQIAGYQPSTTDAIQYAFIDRDVTLFRVMFEEQAYDAARELYTYGYSSRPGSELLPLQRLSTFLGRDLVPQMETFNAYFEIEGESGFTYADNIVQKVLNREGPYETLSPFILTEIGVGAVQYMVMYMAVLQKVYIALSKCTDTAVPTAEALEEWDQGVALFVGSMEGEDMDGSQDDYGMLLFGASKFFCDVFDTCVNNSVNSKMNLDIMTVFDDGQSDIQEEKCDDLALAVSFIEQDLVVPLIQATLHYAVVNEPLTQNSQDGSLGAGHIAAQSVIPLVDDVDAESATDIDTNTNVFFGIGESDPADVFDAFRTAIDTGLNVDCDVVGIHVNFPNGNVCGTAVAPPVGGGSPSPTPSGPVPLGFGRYPFSSTENPLAKIALDLRDMVGSDVDDARQIYSEGRHAVVTTGGENGTLSLADFSTGAEEIMSQDPMFNFFRYALEDEALFEKRQAPDISDSTYADITVRAALDEGLVEVATVAAVALNVWMMMANSLYQSVRDCKDGITDTFRIDNAVALWIGENQLEGSESGWLMYALAETSSRRFGSSDTEAPVNSALIEKFNSANALMQSCSETSDTYVQLRNLVSEMLPLTTIPLFEELLYHLGDGSVNGNLVKLYSLSVVPQMAACDPAAFTYLKEVLIDDDYESFDLSKVDKVFHNLKPLLGCLRLTCDDLQIPKDADDGSYATPFNFLCEDTSENPGAIAGYTPSSDVGEFSRIDLDVLQIDILMQTVAYDTAVDYYINGYNSKPGGDLLSLQNLAKDPARSAVKVQYPLFTKFFGNSDTYADEMILDGFDTSAGAFQGASRFQKAEIVVGTAQTMVMYMAVLQRLFVAVDQCEGGIEGLGETSWDEAVALFVGSIEGPERGGAVGGGGQLLYALGANMCQSFSTCESSGSAAVNERLIDSFSSGRSLLEQGDCANVLALVTENILPVMPVPMIQGALELSSINEGLETGSTSESLAAGHVLAFSVLPLVDDANAESARTVGDNMEFQLSHQPVKDGSAAVYSAFANALSGMGVNCADIGTSVNHSDLSACQGGTGTPKPKPPSTPTNLSEGLYTTTTYVQDRANIAQDVAEIEKHLLNGNINVAKFIYTTGSNSQIFNDNGVMTGQRSLSGFSTTAPTDMKHEPLFNIFNFALQDSKGQYLGKDVGVYADTIVLEAFGNIKPSSKTLASEAAVVLNLWMYVVHELFQTLDQCRRKNIADADGIHSIDEVAAYWIGDGQQTGDAERGHLMYALTEKYGELFDLDQGGQAKANTNILILLNQAKLELTTPNACSDDPKTFPRLYQIVNKIIPHMIVPLIQGLIHNLKVNDRDRVKLYAQSFVPLLSATNPEVFELLSDKLISLNYNAVDMEEILRAVHSTLPGFNLKCEDIGTYVSDDSFACKDPLELTSLAGYRPETDVHQFAKIDLDIRELDILMTMEAHSAANDLYTYGKHVVVEHNGGEKTMSLHEMASSSDRLLVPSFKSFERYFDDDRYADTMVMRGFDSTESNVTPEERREIVVKSSQYMVVYMAALSAFYESLNDCRSDKQNKKHHAVLAWDKAAALLIGSLEGTVDGGSEQGELHHGLAKDRCTQFGTCRREPHNAEVNVRVVELLFAGRAELSADSCNALENGIESIESLLLVPLIQSTLRYAIANMDPNLFSGSREGNLAAGYVFSRSILPLVEDASRESAATLEKAMDLSSHDHDRRDAAAVFDALAEAYSSMGVDCTLVGSTANGASACDGSAGIDDGSGGGASAGAIVGAVIGSIVAIGLGVFGYKQYQKRKLEKASSETTSLVTNELGILDVDSSGLEHKPRVALVDKEPENSFVRNRRGVLSHGEDDSPEQVVRTSSSGLDEHFEDIQPPYSDEKDGLV